MKLGKKSKKVLLAVFFVIVITLIAVLVVLMMDNSENNSDTVGEGGEVASQETKTDEYGNVRTTDPNKITTYFPHYEMREHSNWEPTARYYLTVDEENKVIKADIEYCDEEADKLLVEKYLDSIPMDISEYRVEYEILIEDAICEDGIE